MKYAKNITGLIGNTPLIQLNSISKKTKSLILGKCEFLNPTSSVKDRVGLNMIRDAVLKKKIDKNSTIIEATSGNTGIALASICAAKNLKLILTMPESMSIERRKLLQFFGAKIVLTSANKGMKGAIKKANKLQQKIKNSIILNQFSNLANPEIHEKTTALEILRDTRGKIDFFVAGVGTGGTLVGVGKILKEKIPNIKIVAVEPENSAVLSGANPLPHNIQGIGAGFIPKIFDGFDYDKIITVKDKYAVKSAKKLAKEGIAVGISSGANAVASQILAKQNPNSVIVTILCDTAERYLSTELFS